MNKIINLEDRKPVYDKVRKALESDNFVITYYTAEGELGVIQGTQSSIEDLCVFASVCDYVKSVNIEGMFAGAETEE